MSKQENCSRLRYFLIGENTLALECVKALMQRGFTALGIFSQHAATRHWATAQEITLFDELSEFTEAVNQAEHELLFSIVNPHILPEQIIASPKLMAINYHDGPLPRYAGIHATAHAILNGETTHGITWHQMTNEVDAGDILLQKTVQIENDDTTATLNAKCFEAGTSSFKNLLENLISKKLTPKSQDLSKRTCYQYKDTLLNAGFINWHDSTQTINRQHRASQFGTATNRFGLLKCCLGDTNYIITELAFSYTPPSTEPGTILSCNKASINIASRDGVITIKSLLEENGENVKLAAIVDRHKISAKHLLPQLNSQQVCTYKKKFNRQIAKEKHWEALFKQIAPLELTPLLDLQPKPEDNAKRISFTLKPKELNQSESIALVFAYLKNASYHTAKAATIGYCDKGGFLYPLTILPGEKTHDDLSKLIDSQLKGLTHLKPYATDFFARHPSLTPLPAKLKSLAFDAIIYNTSDDCSPLMPHPHLAIIISDGKITLVDNELCIPQVLLNSMTKHLTTFSSNASKHKNQPLSLISYLTVKEQRHYQGIINRTSCIAPLAHQSITDAFESQLEKTPDAIAIHDKDTSISYQALDLLSNKCAHLLREEGLRPRAVAAFQIKRGITEIVTMLGILKCDGIYLPLEYECPNERRDLILKDANAKLFITDNDKITTTVVKQTVIDNLKHCLAKYSCEPITRNAQADECCYIMYSSGTTGKPKGIAIPHQGVLRLTPSIQDIPLSPNFRCLHASNPAFDASTFEIWPTLLSGGALYSYPSAKNFNINDFLTFVKSTSPDLVFMTPSLFNTIVKFQPKIFASTKNIMLGGEAVNSHYTCLLKSTFKKANLPMPNLLNGYGPTENTAFSICHTIKNKSSKMKIPLGRPIPHTDAFIMNSNLEQVPCYTPGEIILTGLGLSLGYINQDTLNREKFITAQNHQGEPVRAYRTGDLGYFDNKGVIYFIGRKDDQVKKNGYRIELAEIEQVILQQPGINECIATLDKRERSILKVCYTSKSISASTELKDLKSALKAKLPHYMQPDSWFKLESIPLTPNGKIDHAAINALTIRSNTKEVSPKRPIYRLIEKIMKKSIKQQDDFFALGGDSITAMSFAAEAQKHNIPLKVADIFKYPRFKDLDNYIASKEFSSSTSHHPSASANGKPFVLAPIQQWFFHQKFEQPQYFSQSCVLTLNAPLTLAKLGKSLSCLIKKHDALRLRFLTKHLPARQVVAPFGKDDLAKFCHLEEIHCADLSEAYIHEQETLIQNKFDIEAGPLVGAVLLIPRHSNAKLLLVIHHLAVDLVSWQALLNDLVDDFSDIAIDKLAGTVSYQNWIESSAFPQSKEKHQLTPALTNPSYEQQGKTKLINKRISLSRHKTQALMNAAQHYDVPLHTLLLTAMVHAIDESIPTDRIVLHLETHGRHPHHHVGDLSQAVGWFTELTPLLLHWPSNDLLIQLESIHMALMEAKNNVLPSSRPGFADLSLNYWGNLDGFVKPNPFFQCKNLSFLNTDANRLPALFDLNAWVKNVQLELSITFNPLIETIELDILASSLIKSLTEIQLKNTEHPLLNTEIMLDVQKGILHHSLVDHASIYNAQCIVEHQNLKLEKRKQAWQNLSNRIPMLRANVQLKHPISPAFKISRHVSPPIEILDWTDLSETKKQSYFAQWLAKEKDQPFDFEKQTLYRLHYIKWDERRTKEIITFSHMLLDGWSLMLLLNNCDKLYAGKKSLPLKASAFNYTKWLKSQQSPADVKFWQDYLENTPQTLFHRKKLAPQQASVRVQSIQHPLTQEQTNHIRSFCQESGITLNIFFQTVFAIALSQYTGKKDFLIGLTVSGRIESYPDVNDVIGMVSNVLPARFKDLNMQNFHITSKSIQQNTLEILERQHNSLYFVKRALGSSAKGIFFDAVFAFENYPSNSTLIDRVDIKDSTHYPLVFSVYPKKEVQTVFNYHTSVFNTSDIEKLQEMIMQLIDNILSNAAKLPLLKQTNMQPNQTVHAESDITGTLHDRFSAIAKRHPNNIAIQDEKRPLSYAELDTLSNQLAHQLHDMGIKPNSKVGLHVKRNTNLIIYILSILKAGAAYIPLDQDAPETRNNFIIEHAKADLVITDSASCNWPKDVAIMQAKSLLKNLADFNAEPIPLKKEDALAYVIFTSGTTGQPKGVMVHHKNVLGLIKAAQQNFAFTKDETWMLFHSHAFDVSVWEIFAALLTGGRLTIPPSDITKSPESAYRWICNYQVTVFNQTPAAFSNFIAAEAKQPIDQLPLKIIILAGDKLNLTKLSGWFSRHPSTPKIVNMYGITETTVHSTYQEITQDSLNELDRSPIGHPLPGWQVFTLNEHLVPVQPGEIGEIYVGGVGLAQGYINDEKLTNERFIQSPFSTDKNHRLYKSGDMALLNEDGSLNYLGRNDLQVKIRGYRVEPYEIEQMLNKLPFVKQAKILCCKNTHGNSLAAYLVMDNQEHQQTKLIRQQLFKKLPHYMVPTHIVFLDSFPLNVNGKIDTDKLPEPGLLSNPCVDTTASDTYRKLKSVWQQVLRQDKIQADDDFFDIGGNSFSAFHLLTMINETFKSNLPLRFIQECTTLSSQEAAITGDMYSGYGAKQSLICLKHTGKKTPLFLIHPVGGSIFWFKNLAKYFTDDRPLYAIQDPALQPPHHALFDSVETMAEAYTKLINTVAPNGPYYIGGASAGATTSIAIANTLLSQGNAVNFIGLFDGWVLFPDGLKNRDFFEKNMQRQFSEMKQGFLSQGIQSADDILALQWQRSQINAAYQVPSLKQKLTLFKASETIPVYQPIDAPYNYWETRTPVPIDLYNVPGNHESMFFEPHVRKLAKCLSKALQETEKDHAFISYEKETTYSES